MPNVLAFGVVVAVIVVVPGPDMALVLRNGLAGGRRAAVETALGINAGLLAWAVAAALGVAALLQASAPAFTALKLVGAAYLVWLGASALNAARRGAPERNERDRRPAVSPFRQGVLSNLLNPKIALVFTTLIPQFVDPRGAALPQTALLAAVFIGMGVVWLTAYALVVARAGAVLRRPRVRRVLHAVTGTAWSRSGCASRSSAGRSTHAPRVAREPPPRSSVGRERAGADASRSESLTPTNSLLRCSVEFLTSLH